MHEYYMELAIEQANNAQQLGEVPVGAIVVVNNEVVGKGHNLCITENDPSLHAEMVAIREAAKTIGNYRLVNSSLYVTLEPCAMCAGLLVHSRIQNLYYGANDPKAGACGSIMNLVQHDLLNHKIRHIESVLGQKCSEQLSSFFRKRRQQIKTKKAALKKENRPTEG